MQSIVLQLLVVVLCLAVTTAHAQELPWRIQAQLAANPGGDISFRKIDAPDTVHVMALGFGGSNQVVCRTTDGGATWDQPFQRWGILEFALHDLSHPTPLVAVVVGDTLYQENDTGSTIFYTHDGGDSWQQGWCDSCTLSYEGRSGIRSPLRCTSMCDSLNGILTGYAFVLARTTDGGKTWHRISDPTNGKEDFYAAQCLNPSTYILTTSIFLSGVVNTYRTTDSGRTWTHTILPRRTFTSDFIDSLQGWAVGYEADSIHFTNIIARTADGGRTWDTLFNAPTPTWRDGDFNHVAMADAAHGIVTGSGGSWAITTDGTTWRQGPNIDSMFKFKVPDVTGITYPHPSKAWAVTPSGQILVYEPKTATVARASNTSASTTIEVFPNPIPRSTPATIALEIHERTSSARLSVTNALGQEVNVVEISGALDPGEHRIAYTVPAASGHYFIRLISDGRTISIAPIIVQ